MTYIIYNIGLIPFMCVPVQMLSLLVELRLSSCLVMRDFQTWLIMQVMVARGAACQVISELPVCPDYTVYTSQVAEQDNKTHLTWPKQTVPTAFSVYRCHNTELGICISQRQGICQVWPWELAICQ